jgi:hypothetical protein
MGSPGGKESGLPPAGATVAPHALLSPLLSPSRPPSRLLPQPVQGDWRQRVRQPDRQETRAASPQEAAGGGGAAADGMPDLDALSAGLPPGWRAMWDREHRMVYYGNLGTSVSVAATSQPPSVPALQGTGQLACACPTP